MIYTEITPNPASLKFVVGQRLLPLGKTVDFGQVSEAEESPLAKKLFDFRFVERVFLASNFLTITKDPAFQWEEVIPVVKDFLKAYIASDQAIVTGELAEELVVEEAAEDDETVQKIKSLLESHVRPAVAGDGGDITFEKYQDGVLQLRLLGACSGCPSSTATLKDGIERLMVSMVPGVKMVEAV